MTTPPLHGAQITALKVLRRLPNARFRDLLAASQLESDVFKFHIRKLVELGHVQKAPDGTYGLTDGGKEFANNLDEQSRTVQKQPKVSVLILVREPNVAGEPRYLFTQRRRSPYYGFWGCIGGPVGWGEPFEAAAARELQKQTGLAADCIVSTFLRTRDYALGGTNLLEDKLFAITEATNITGRLTNTWTGGTHTWMTADEYKAQPHIYRVGYEMIDWVQSGNGYHVQTEEYGPGEY